MPVQNSKDSYLNIKKGSQFKLRAFFRALPSLTLSFLFSNIPDMALSRLLRGISKTMARKLQGTRQETDLNWKDNFFEDYFKPLLKNIVKYSIN